jgi:hypothetical protein
MSLPAVFMGNPSKKKQPIWFSLHPQCDSDFDTDFDPDPENHPLRCGGGTAMDSG